jgi:hypothetical protein
VTKPRRLIIFAIALVAIVALYWRTRSFGFYWDDFHFVRPYSVKQVATAWIGPWDARDNLEAPFFRPLTVTWFALRNAIFGLSAPLVHTVSIVMFTACVWLFILLSSRLSLSTVPSLVGVLVFVVHPVTSIGAVSWITNQMHLLQLLIVISALVRAAEGPHRWRWILGLQVIALLVKEDGVMLPFAIAGLWLLRRATVPRAWMVTTAMTPAGYLGLRYLAVGSLGGYDVPEYGPLWKRALVGLHYTVAPTDEAGWVLLAIVAGSALARWRIGPANRSLLYTSIALLLLFNFPLMLAPLSYAGPNRWHLLGLALACGVAASLELVAPSRVRFLMFALSYALVVLLGIENWAKTNELGPCAPFTRTVDQWVREWGSAVPVELMEGLAKKNCGAP